ncbi:HSF-type DNA-binding protein [Nitzschia inconspicua]|uniref:HSF-type DNA-binding protein n=1 Tax=Nitzschia inconspicua TaxID=303405 RepID=A0A9K3KF20_9STRA|nr:HSF-type DNA-binding protein [Nitzschia inconspicua]
MTIETTSTNTNSQQMRFPSKLHMLLERTDASSVISWMPDGKSFLIHDKDRFSQELLAEFFGTTNFKTFQRNLNLWAFTRISKGPNKDQTSHPLFLRGFPGLSRNMKRIVLKGTGRGNRAPRGGISDFDAIKQRALISDVSSVSSTSSTLTGTGQPSASYEKSNGAAAAAAAAALASYTTGRDNKTTNNGMPHIAHSGMTSGGHERLGFEGNASTPGPASATFKSLAPSDKQVLDANSIQQLASLIQTLRNGETTAPSVTTPTTTTTTSFSSPLLSALYAAQAATKLLPSQLSLLSSSAPLATSTNDVSCNKLLLQALLQQQQQNRQQQLQEAQQQQQLVLQQAVLKQALERQLVQHQERQERIASALKSELLLNRILLSQGGGIIMGQQQP